MPFMLLLFALIPFFPLSSSLTRYRRTLTPGSSLSAPDDVLVSLPSGIFTAGFHPVGTNAYYFAIWFSEALADGNCTIIWMANREQPVNSRNTKLTLQKSGNLVLTDAGQLDVWSSDTYSASFVQLQLNDTGNLVLQTDEDVNIWQSFDSPTDTLLPQQSLTRKMELVSSWSRTNYSSGFYKLFFDNDNILKLLYNGDQITSIFWPIPFPRDGTRDPYNASKVATFDLMGNFVSSDNFTFHTSDRGLGPQRRITIDPDGNLRAYSLDKGQRSWKVTWQGTPQPCKTNGICGANSLCTYTPEFGPRCSCMQGHKMKNHMDWWEGCVPDFEIPCNGSDPAIVSRFLKYSHAELYGYDIGFFDNYTLEDCKRLCLSYCNCKGFQYKYDDGKGSCLPKYLLLNGYQSSDFNFWFYLRLPKDGISSSRQEEKLKCQSGVMQLNMSYKKRHEQGWVKSLFLFTGALGALEILFFLIFLYSIWQPSGSSSAKGYRQAATKFKRFTYSELKKASRNFCEEVGRGGSGVVYKGKLPDGGVAAIKCLNEANQGEAEFLAEVSLIGRLNHANLIEAWGYCAEGKHRILVYEYLEHGSLAENLNSHELDWGKRFNIALGTAKGLAYLHEECLEWVLHCDVKPENILLDTTYQPKVADFGLSKLLNRSIVEESHVSRIRGTRGYMAPEWVSQFPITSKVDVYSYGIVVLEMVTGRNFKDLNADAAAAAYGVPEQKGLVSWVREMMNETASWMEQIIDPMMGSSEYDVDRLENLVKVALQCAHENKDARPTMRQVVDMLIYGDVEER